MVLFNSLPFTLIICPDGKDAFQIPSGEEDYSSNLRVFRFGLQLDGYRVIFFQRSLNLVDHVRPQWADEAAEPLEIPLDGSTKVRINDAFAYDYGS